MGALDGRVALVTGAGRGVGRGIALALASAGASVGAVGRSHETLDPTVEEIRKRGGTAIAVECDVKNRDDIERTVATVVQELGSLNILVNNAQEVSLGPLLGVTESDLSAAWESGPLAAVRFMQQCHPHLEGGGSIVNLASAAAIMENPYGFGVYGAVKSAMLSISRSAAMEWGSQAIRVNSLIPLAMSDAMVQWSGVDPEGFGRVVGQTALGRVGDCEADIGRAVVFLVSDEASYVTGTILTVDGGQERLR